MSFSLNIKTQEELDFINNNENQINNYQEYDNLILKYSNLIDTLFENVNDNEIRLILDMFALKFTDIRRYIEIHKEVNTYLDVLENKIYQKYDKDIDKQIDEIFYNICGDLLDNCELKIMCKLLQRMIYLCKLIPLRKIYNKDDLLLEPVATVNKNNKIYQSSIYPNIFFADHISDHAYISNGILFYDEENNESFLTSDSKIIVKYPIKSNDLIPTVIRIKDDKLVKNDKRKYKKLAKRILNVPIFL